MTVDERKAEIARRNRNRDAGRSVTDDGPGIGFGNPAPRSTIKEAFMAADAHISVQLVLPWSCLVPDNAKYAAAIKAGGAFILLATEYRNAKNKAVEEVERQMTAHRVGRFPKELKLRIEARMFEPNRHKRRDISNYTKLVHDALTGLVYADDSQLDRVLWVRAGVDIDRPRLELEVAVLP